MITERDIFTSNFERLTTAPTGLTLTPERPYAKRGTARMSDHVELDELSVPLPEQLPVKNSKDKEKDEKEAKLAEMRLESLRSKTNEIKAELKEKPKERWTDAELQKAYTELHGELSAVKLFTSPRNFLKALTIVGPVETEVRTQLLAKQARRDELRELRHGSFMAPKVALIEKHTVEDHENDELQKNRENALTHLWERKYSPAELEDPEIRKGIETAVAAGYLPTPEPEKDEELDADTKQELEYQQKVLEEADVVEEKKEEKDDAHQEQVQDSTSEEPVKDPKQVNRENALRYLWNRKYTPQELNNPEIQKTIEAAVSLGQPPLLETENEDELDEKTQRELALQRRVLEKADEVGENKELDNDERVERAWDTLIEKRHAGEPNFKVSKLTKEERTREIQAILREQKQKVWDTVLERRHAGEENFKLADQAAQEREAEIAETLKEYDAEYKGEEDIELQYVQSQVERNILAAHEVGSEDATKGVYTYSQGDIRQKYEKLREVGFQKDDVRLLMEAGIAGSGTETRPWDPIDTSLTPSEPEKKSITKKSTRNTIEDPGGGNAGPPIVESITNDEDLIEDINAQLRQADVLKNYLDTSIDGAQSIEEMQRIVVEKLQGNIDMLANEIALKQKKNMRDVTISNFQGLFESDIKEVNAAIAAGDLTTAKLKAKDIAQKLNNEQKTHYQSEVSKLLDRREENDKGERGMKTVRNFDDILEQIIKFDPEKYGDGAPQEVYKTEKTVDPVTGVVTFKRVKDENGVEIINQDNFINWVQERMVFYSNFDPDAPIDFFSKVVIENPELWSPIQLGRMVSNHTNLMRRKSGKHLDELYEQITDMGWIDGQIRNNDATYRMNMSDDSKFADMFRGLFQSNAVGKEAQRTGINTFANMFMMDATFNPDTALADGDMQIGIATESSFLFYYNMTDAKELKKLFGNNMDVFYSYDALDRAIEVAMKGAKRDPSNLEDKKKFIEEEKFDKLTKLYDKAGPGGRVREDKIGAFLKEINVFDPPTKNRRQLEVGRSLVQQVAGLESGLLQRDTLTSDAIGNVRGTLGYAEMRAHWLTHQMGAAAKQDLACTAINAMTKVTRFQKYLNKQADPGRAGGIGNPFEYPLLKTIVVDPMSGVLTNSGETSMQLLRQLHEARRGWSTLSQEQKEAKKADIKHILSRWTYGDLSWRQYPGQHVANGFKEFHDRTSGKEIHIDGFASFDIFGNIVYDHAKMISEVQEGLIKPTRYRWATHRLAYEENRREFLKATDKEIKYKDSTLAEEMYGPQVLITAAKMQMHEYEVLLKKGDNPALLPWLQENGLADSKGKLLGISSFIDKNGRYLRITETAPDGTETEKLSKAAEAILKDRKFSNSGRMFVKSYLTSKFAVQLHSVSHYGTGHKKLDFSTREAIIAALGHIPAGIDDHHAQTDFRDTHVSQFFFNDYDLKLMRQMSGNEFWRNFMKAAGADLSGGGMDAFMQGFKVFFKQIMKI